MMEPLDLEERESVATEKPWAVKGTHETRANLISSIFLESDGLEEHERKLEAKYIRAQKVEQRYEAYRTEDSEILLVGFGIVSRVLLSAVEALRREGVRAGMFRPITLWPYPSEALAKAAANVHSVLVVELSNGQMVEDVRVALNGKVPVEFYGRVGGNVPSIGEVQDAVAGTIAKHATDFAAQSEHGHPKTESKPLATEGTEAAGKHTERDMDERFIDLFSTVV
jgi:pyruvate/2-oxoacid:ferredoxin oxidoreductase alpha subunit